MSRKPLVSVQKFSNKLFDLSTAAVYSKIGFMTDNNFMAFIKICKQH